MNPAPPTDAELVARATSAREGDTRAFDVLVERHKERVLTNCRYLTRSPDDAEDLAQEAFMKAYFGLSRFRGDASFQSWITRIKTNHCLNWLRSQKNREFVDVENAALGQEEELQVAPRAPRAAEAASEGRVIREVLDEMGETLRVPLILRDLDELPYEEISEQLGIGLSATKMRIKRGREEFRSRYAARVDSGLAEAS